MDDRSEAIPHGKSSARNVARGVTWLSLARTISAVVGLLSTAILARLLAPADFGIIVIVVLVANLASCFVEGGVSLAVVQRPELTNAFTDMAFIVAFGLAIASAIAIAAATALGWIPGLTQGSALFIFASLSVFPFRAWSSVLNALLQRQGQFRHLTIIAIASSFFGNTIPAIILAALGFGAWALVAGFIFWSLLEFILLYIVVRPRLPRNPDWRLLRDMRSTCVSGGTLQLLNWAALSTPNMIVASSFGMTALGLFQRGSTLVNLFKDVLGTSLARVLLPAFSSLHSEPDRLKSAFQRALAVGLPVFAFASVAPAIHAEPIIKILLGANWTDTISVLMLLSLGILPRIAYKITETLLYSKGNFAEAAKRQLVFLVLTAALCAPAKSLVDVAIAVTVATHLFYLFSLGRVAHVLGLTGGELAKPHIVALAVAGIAGLIDLLIIHILLPVGFWPAHIAGAFFSVATFALLSFLPVRLVGQFGTEARSLLTALTQSAIFKKWKAILGMRDA